MQGLVSLTKLLQTPSSMLSDLSLPGNFMGNKGLEVLCHGLRGNTQVMCLDLSHNDITKKGAEML